MNPFPDRYVYRFLVKKHNTPYHRQTVSGNKFPFDWPQHHQIDWKCLTLYFIIITPFVAFEISHIWKYYGKWSIFSLKILWKMEHLLFWSKCSIFHNILKRLKVFKISWIFFSLLSENRKWCHDPKIAYGVKNWTPHKVPGVCFIGALQLLGHIWYCWQDIVSIMMFTRSYSQGCPFSATYGWYGCSLDRITDRFL